MVRVDRGEMTNTAITAISGTKYSRQQVLATLHMLHILLQCFVVLRIAFADKRQRCKRAWMATSRAS
jgi:hypothetical protein